MQPACLSAGWIGRVSSSSRNLVVVCAATIVGIVVGGVSVLGVAIAVIQPPAHDAPAGSAVFDGQPHVLQQVPTASSAEPQTIAAPLASAVMPAGAASPSAALQAHPVTPIEAQAAPLAQRQTPAQVLDKTWPEVPTARPPRASEATAAAPPSPPASNVASKGQTMTTRTVTPYNYSQTPVAPNPDTTKRRVVVIPDDSQQSREDDADTVSARSSSRPLFDFFGTFGDERLDGNRNAVSDQPPPQPRSSRNSRDQQLVIRHRQDSDDDNQEAVNTGPPPQYDSWNNFFGYSRNDNWHN
jgi:hypothetical protein